MNITVRNIPDNIVDKLRKLSEIEKRSLNNEILVLIEKGLSSVITKNATRLFDRKSQIAVWKKLAGKWKDSISTDKIIKEIYDSRTNGRDVSL